MKTLQTRVLLELYKYYNKKYYLQQYLPLALLNRMVPKHVVDQEYCVHTFGTMSTDWFQNLVFFI